jgi:hypothetical protein
LIAGRSTIAGGAIAAVSNRWKSMCLGCRNGSAPRDLDGFFMSCRQVLTPRRPGERYLCRDRQHEVAGSPTMKSILHPYRKPQPTAARAAKVLDEELIVYAALCVVGAIPVAIALSQDGAFGVEPTLGLLMGIAGIAGLISALLTPRDPDVR